jgi:photosystem II stability/assembly factor-like uncharacterized protein
VIRHRALGAVVVAGLAALAALVTTVGPVTVEAAAPKRVAEAENEKHPESFRELQAAQNVLGVRRGTPSTTRAGALEAAMAQRAVLAQTSPSVPGATNTWQPYGNTALISDDPQYTAVGGEGFGNLSGRAQGLAYDPADRRHWFVGVSYGGVHETNDAGATWHSIGDNLPTQIVGALGYTTGGGGTLVAGTGDPAMGGDGQAGLGVFWTNDLGKTWTKSTGVPTASFSFKVAVDPTNPAVVYVANSQGLYRSADAGRTFTNVVLPTTCTDLTNHKCFLANIVTDVVVRPADANGQGGGKVLAAVGWRGGRQQLPEGFPAAPQNGLYEADDGVHFHFVNPTGFTPQQFIGRTALGIATGAGQNHDIVFALVSDAGKLENDVTTLDVPEPQGKPIPNATTLNGIFVSSDFGQSWVKMTDPEQLKLPGTGSSLEGLQTATYAPGVQSWYNLWIQPDPAATDANGEPTRVLFGLEEIWDNQQPLNALNYSLPSPGGTVGATPMKVIGRYYGDTSCAGLVPLLPVCPTSNPPTAVDTTHPDQHAMMIVPDASGGGETLVVGHDGGLNAQHIAAGGDFSQSAWGKGNNVGLRTLQPYHLAVARDGVAYAGLQDNGEMRVTADGTVKRVQGGDGFFSAVDPDHSDTAYQELTYGAMYFTTDGGKNWSNIDPSLTSAQFSTPFSMDPLDANHLLIAGRDVQESTFGPKTDSSSDGIFIDAATQWQKVYDLGTAKHPGDANAADAPPDDAANSASATDVRGNAAYIGFCAGTCEALRMSHPTFGIATNVGGDKPGKPLTGDGWHIAKAQGLPQRFITSVRIDPTDVHTIYVTLGDYSRDWLLPGVLGDDISRIGKGHIYRSTDAGDHFTDLSGNLPDAPAYWSALHNRQLLVATDVGVFVAPSADGGTFSLLGGGLPLAPVVALTSKPGDPDVVLAATFGRGLYSYRFAPAPAATKPARATEIPATGGGGPQVGLVLLALAVVVRGLSLGRRPRASRRSRPA